MGLSDTFFPGSGTPAAGGRASGVPDDDSDISASFEDEPPPSATASNFPGASTAPKPAAPPAPPSPPAGTPVAAANPDDGDSPNAAPASSGFPGPRPATNRFNYTQFASNPGLADMFAPEIAQEQANQRQDAANAAADQQARNRQALYDATQSGLRTTRDAQGNVVPLTDPDSGQPLYHPHMGQVQYDPQTGQPFQVQRDQYGQHTTVNPDANAPVGPNADDPTDPQLYRQNQYQSWQPLGHVDDLAGDKDQPADVRNAAQAWQQKRAKLIEQAGLQAAERTSAHAQAAHIGAQQQLADLTGQNQQLQQQLDAIDADPNASQTQGGFLGIGASPTPAAVALAARRTQLEQQQTDVQTRLNATRTQLPTLKAAAQAATADAAITRHGLDLSNYASLADQRRQLLQEQGKSAANDPVLAAIEKKSADLNVKLSAARADKAALAGGSPDGPPPPLSGQTPVASGPTDASAQTAPGPGGSSPSSTPPAPPAAPSSPSGPGPQPQTPVPASSASPAQQTPATPTGQAAPALPSGAVSAYTPAAPGVAGSAQPFSAKDAPYRVDSDGQLSLDPARMVAGMIAARNAGLITTDKLMQLLPKAKAAQDAAQAQQQLVAEYQAKQASAGNFAPGKAAAFGAAKGLGFLAAAAPGAAAGESVGAALSPFTFGVSAVAGPIIGGLITGTLGSMAVDKTARALAQHSDTIRSFTDASDLHPYYDAAGNLISVAAGLPKVATNVAAKGFSALADAAGDNAAGKLAQNTAEKYAQGSGSLADTIKNLTSKANDLAAQGASSGQIATQVAKTVGGSVAANVAIGAGLKEGQRIIGLGDEHETLGGALQDAAIGAITSGHHLGMEEQQRLQAYTEAMNTASAQLGPISIDTAADHLAIPSTPTATANPAVADAALAANFAARNPNAPQIDPAVASRAREFAPPGTETTVPLVLAGIDRSIEGLEQQAADPSQGDVAQRKAQLQLASAYAQKAELVRQSDTRLLAVQQVSALPDWQPPTDANGQPTAPADPGRDRDTAGALLKIANGFTPDQLTAAEQARLDPDGAAPPLTRKAPDGSTILTDAGRQQLAQAAPAALPLIGGSEADALRSNARNASNEAAKANIENEQEGANSSTSGENVPETAQNTPESDDSASGKAIANRLVDRLRQQVIGSGEAFTPAREQRARELAGTAADNLTSALQKYRNAFASVGMDVVEDEEVGSGGVHSPGPAQIRLSLGDIAHPDNLQSLQNPARAERAVQEEAIHSVAQYLESQGQIDPTAVWHSLPGVLQRRVEAAYPDLPDARNKGHEALRMVVQGRLNMNGEGWLVDGHLLTEQTDPGLFAQTRQAIFKLFRFFQDMHGSLLRAGAKPEDAHIVKGSADLLEAAMRGVIDPASVPADDGATDGGAPPPAAAAHPEGATGPEPGTGARDARAAGVSGLPARVPGDAVGEGPTAVAPAAPAPDDLGTAGQAASGPRLPTDEERQRAAAGLGVDPAQIGHVAEVTSSAGQRVRTAYAVREAADARPSHNPEGVPTPGYPQDFQPRDRSGASYRRQAQNIAGDLDLDRLADSPRPDEGSPIVTGAGHTLTGNGRDIAIGLSYRQGNPAAGRYKARLFQRAPEFGLDRAAVGRMRQPVLHRVILGHESPDALRRFSEDSNASPAMASNALETATQDARRLSPPLLSLFDPNYDLESPKNADFLKAFGQQVILGRTRVGEGTANELNIAPSDLARRARLALFSAAYGGDSAGRAALERMGGDSEDRGRNISQSLLTMAPVMARLRADSATGDLHPGYDLSGPLARAAQEISEAVANRPAKQSAGAAIDGLLSQQTFDSHPLDRAVLGFFARNRANRAALEEGLSNYAEAVYGLGNPKDGADLFGERQMPGALELFQKAANLGNDSLRSQRAGGGPDDPAARTAWRRQLDQLRTAGRERLQSQRALPAVDENGVHDLAKPRGTAYLSEDEQQRDPAHVLQSLVRRGAPTDERQRWKPGRQLAGHARLVEATAAMGREIDPAAVQDQISAAPPDHAGGEHVVHYDEATGRVYKYTKPGLYGAQGDDAGAYLQRWALHNRAFGDDAKFEGQVHLPGEDEPRTVMSQPFVDGRDSTPEEQANYLTERGFRQQPDGSYIHPVTGIKAWDTITPGNAKTMPDGTVRPIDLQVAAAGPEELRHARAASGIGEPSVFSQRARPVPAPADEAGGNNEGQRKLAAKLWREKGTDSPFFQRWFADSKAVDPHGKPLVLYHGSPALTRGGFDSFRVPENAGDLLAGRGVYLTDNKPIAQSYTLNRDELLSGGSVDAKSVPDSTPVMPLYANITKPFQAGDAGMADARAIVAAELAKQPPEPPLRMGGKLIQPPSASERAAQAVDNAARLYPPNDPLRSYQILRDALSDEGIIQNARTSAGDQLHDVLQAHGYDGITHEGGVLGGQKHDVWIAFDPTQVKSAEAPGNPRANAGEFRADDPNILRSQHAQPAADEQSSEASSSHPIDDLLAMLDAPGRQDALDRRQQQAGDETQAREAAAAAGAKTLPPRTVGRPDLAFGGASDAHRAVDQARADEHVAQTQAGWNEEANRRYAADPQGEVRHLAAKALAGDQLDAVETKIAQRAVADELAKPDSAEQRRKVQAMIYGYRMTGTEQARAMAARFDPHQTPEQRSREFLGRMIYTPPAEVRARLEQLPQGDTAGRRAILEADQQRVSHIEAELKKMGVSFDDIFRGEVELKLKGAKIINNTATELFDGARQRALKLLQGGTRSFADVGKAVGLDEGAVKQAYNQMREALKAKLRDKVRRGATAENLDMQTLRAQPAGGAEPAFKSDVDTEAELDRILNQMGYFDPGKVGRMKTRVPTPKKEIFRPPAAPADPAQLEAWKRGGVGDDVRARVPVGQKEMNLGGPAPTGTGERADTRFVKPAGDEQGRIDFAGQEPPVGGGTGERANGKFLQTPQGRMDFGEEPQRVGSLDLSDPVVASRLSRAIQAAGSNVYDKAFEFWSAGLLSGPQTHVAIGVGNTLNAGFELTAQRGMEALLNLAYRDPNAAQFGEMKYILKGLMPGIRAGLDVGLKSFQAEASMFEPTFLDQQLALDPGEHMNAGHKVAIQGKLGKIVRLPFRAVGFMDGFMKTSIWHMQVAAEAYRMAKAEGLQGSFLAKRMEELSAPGSEAAIRAVTRAEEMIGQAPYLSDEPSPADAEAQRVDGAYRQARAEGKTGDDITARATELLRAPDTGGWRRFVPPPVAHNPLDVAMSHFQTMARSTKLLSYVFPYLRMPYNLMKMGLRKSPLGVTNIAARLINSGLYKIKEGRPVFETYPAALQTRHLAEQTFAWLAASALYSAVEGDGEDDRKKRFLITGTRSFTADKQGQRDLLERTAGGATTLRVGDTTINYGRYEPIATVLSTVADAVRTIKAMGNGANMKDGVDKFMGYISDQVMSKTMLQGMADLQKDIAGGTGTADRAKRAMMTALVPNIIRQPLRNLDDYVRDSHGAPAPYSFFPAGGFAEKKLTPYGQPVEKTGNPVSRVLFPAATKPFEKLNNADRMLMNWNAKHPGEAWAPEPLSRKKPDPKTGKDTEMSNEEYATLQRRAALKLSVKLAGAVNSSNASHPTADDIHALKTAFEQAHHEAKQEAFGSKKDPLPTAPLPKTTAPRPHDAATMLGFK